MMRVVFAATSSLDSPYGGGRALPLARALARRGVDVHIVTLHHNLPEAPRRTWVQDGVTIHYVGQMHVRKVGDDSHYFPLLQLLWVMLTALIAMTRTLLALRPDVIHLGKPHPQNTIAGLIAARLRPRTLLLLDSDDYEAESNRTSGGAQRGVLRFFEDVAPALVDGVTTHTTFLYDRLIRLGVAPERILRLPNPVDVARFATPEAEQVQAWQEQLAAEGSIVLYVGTLSLANHPVQLLLAAFAIVHARQPSALLVLAGGGKDFAFLNALAEGYGIADATRFLGRVPAAQIPALYATATVTVDPVEADDTARARFPLKIIESLAAGVPVATGNIGDRAAILRAEDAEASAGLLVDAGDGGALADAIEQLLLADAVEADETRRLAQTIARRYDSDALVESLLEFYKARLNALRGAA